MVNTKGMKSPERAVSVGQERKCGGETHSEVAQQGFGSCWLWGWGQNPWCGWTPLLPWVDGCKSHLFSLLTCLFGRYGTRASLSGPYLTSVMGNEAGEREFWQLIRAPDTPLQQGESGVWPPLAVFRPQPCPSNEASSTHPSILPNLPEPQPRIIMDAQGCTIYLTEFLRIFMYIIMTNQISKKNFKSPIIRNPEITSLNFWYIFFQIIF